MVPQPGCNCSPQFRAYLCILSNDKSGHSSPSACMFGTMRRPDRQAARSDRTYRSSEREQNLSLPLLRAGRSGPLVAKGGGEGGEAIAGATKVANRHLRQDALRRTNKIWSYVIVF